MSGPGFTMSPESDQIVPAWAAALLAVEGVTKGSRAEIETKVGDDYAYSYADLNSVLRECNRVTAANGIVISQIPTYVSSPDHPPMFALRTTLIHAESGQWIAFDPLVGKTPDTPQKAGGAITYYRRYALVSLFNLQQFDNDAISAERGLIDEAAAEREVHQRAKDAYAALGNLDDGQKSDMREMANGRKFGIETLRADVEWLSEVERAIVRLTEPEAIDQ